MNCLYTGNGTYTYLVKMAAGIEYYVYGASFDDINRYWEDYLLTNGYK